MLQSGLVRMMECHENLPFSIFLLGALYQVAVYVTETKSYVLLVSSVAVFVRVVGGWNEEAE